MGRFLSSDPHPVTGRPAPSGASWIAAKPPVKLPPAAAAKAPVSSRVDFSAIRDEYNPVRKFAFYAALATLLVRLSVLSEVIASLTGVNTYLLYILAPPAILGALLTGAVKRTFQQRAAYYWLGFFGWMIVATPFSSWRGASTHLTLQYGEVEFGLLFVVGGLAVTWKEIRLIFYTFAVSGLLNLLLARLFMHVDYGRISLTEATTTIGNSNDLASHLLLVVPFLLFIVMDPKRGAFLRIATLAPIGYAMWVIVGTASRGAVIALLAVTVFVLWRASMRQRISILAFALLLAVVLPLALPKSTLDRIWTFYGKENDEAEESANSRSYLFRQSVIFTLQHPLFGVGPGEFSDYEGGTSLKAGRLGNWHQTHCSWTQVSSECGIPGLLMFVFGVGSAVVLVNRTYRTARVKGNVEIANACFCYLVAMTGFLASISFLANAYRFYFPVMIGLAISMSFVANQHMAGSATALPAATRRA